MEKTMTTTQRVVKVPMLPLILGLGLSVALLDTAPAVARDLADEEVERIEKLESHFADQIESVEERFGEFIEDLESLFGKELERIERRFSRIIERLEENPGNDAVLKKLPEVEKRLDRLGREVDRLIQTTKFFEEGRGKQGEKKKQKRDQKRPVQSGERIREKSADKE